MSEKPDLHFGYSIKMANEDKTANVQIRLVKPISYRDLVESLRALAKEIEREAKSGKLDKDVQ